ncbi:MAG TPA: type I restriction endonuclease subunit R, partial [Mariniflexile sp.]|nr:type I restriction endonuclease subunit R [Mariniflexile sp.]
SHNAFQNKEAIDVIIMQPYEDYAEKFNEAYIALLKITPTVNSVNNLISEEDELEFIKAFRELMRLKNTMSTFANFDWEDLAMPEQLFENYKSKYLDLHDKVKTDNQKEKVSILEDVDFELELIHRDEINVTYILKLLAALKDAKITDQETKQKEVVDLLIGESNLRSKRELIEKFIIDNLPEIEDSDNIPQEFEKFWTLEQQKAFEIFVKEENLSSEKTQKLIENYLYAEREPLIDELLDLIKDNKPSVLKRKSIGDRILNKVINFVETFINGMDN